MTPLATEGVRNADSMQKTRCQTPLSPSEINNLIEALHQGVTPATAPAAPNRLPWPMPQRAPNELLEATRNNSTLSTLTLEYPPTL